jgi:transposase
VVRAVEAGASCHEAAAAFEVSPSSAIRWVARFRRTGSVAAKPMGGKRSPLDAHKQWLEELIAAEPDLTLQEIRGRLRGHGIRVAASSVWRFCERHDITFKKKACTQPNKTATTCAWRARTGSESSRGLIRRSSSSSTRPERRPI